MKKPKYVTLEANSYLDGLFRDFAEQMNRYKSLNQSLKQIEARIDLAEKTLCFTREHLELALKETEGAEDRMAQFQQEAAKVRFVGIRLADACELIIKEQKKVSPTKLLDILNVGTIRFRTNAPLREIHATLLKHPHIKRVEDYYVWAKKEEQLRFLKAKAASGAGVLTVPRVKEERV